MHGPFVLNVTLAPTNDEPANAIQLFPGVNPSPPNGQNGLVFTNVNATNSPGSPYGCNGGGGVKDVYFRYVATTTCPVTFSMCDPAGFSSENVDSIMEISDELSGAYLDCDDDGCGVYGAGSVVTVLLTAGRSYLIRISGYGVGYDEDGTFYLTVSTTPALTIDSPNGPGSLRIANGGGPGNVLYYTALTTFPGGFPNGWFYGVDISLAEVFTQLASGAPFIGVLNADGGSNFSLSGLPTLGVTIYGVTLIFNGNLLIGATPPVAHSI